MADHFQRRRPTPALTLPGRSGRSGPHPARGGGRDPKSEIEQGLTEATAPADEPRDLSVLPGLYQFLAHNQQLRQKVELWQTRLPHRLVSDLDEAVFAAYTQRLQNVSSIPELNRFLHERHATQPRCLHLSEADLLGEHAAVDVVAATGRVADVHPERLALVEVLDRIGLYRAANEAGQRGDGGEKPR